MLRHSGESEAQTKKTEQPTAREADPANVVPAEICGRGGELAGTRCCAGGAGEERAAERSALGKVAGSVGGPTWQARSTDETAPANLASLSGHPALDDPGATLDARTRSWLHVILSLIHI